MKITNICKNNIRHYVQKYPRYDSDKLIAKTERYEYISFDIFDTLIKRSVLVPSEVFIGVAEQYHLNTGVVLDSESFKTARIEAEKQAIAIAKEKGREETTLEEIYLNISEPYRSIGNKLMELEIRQELLCCHANPVMKKVFDACIVRNKHIFIVSDMYLPINIIKQVLDEAGYKGYDELFLSSEIGLKKRSGSLYSYILDKEKVCPSKLLHIGDDIRSDYIQPIKHGIHAVRIARNPTRTSYVRSCRGNKVQWKRFQTIANGWIDPQWDPYFKYGFEVVGLLLYGFCKWLHKSAVEDGTHKLFFLARDGYIIQRAYQVIFGEEALPNQYLYVSRRSVSVPLFALEPSFEKAWAVLPKYSRWGIADISEKFGIEEQHIKMAWDASGLSEVSKLTAKEMMCDPRAKRFFDLIKKVVENSARNELDNLVGYLSQSGFADSVGVVDIGWRGTIQNGLQKIIDYKLLDAHMIGYYVGLSSIINFSEKMKGYIPKDKNVQRSCVGFFELPFTSMEGSVKSYKVNSKSEMVPLLHNNEWENSNEKIYIRNIQQGALYFVSAMKTSPIQQEYAQNASVNNLYKICRSPSKKELDMFSNISFKNFGVKPIKMCAPKPLSFYIMHPQQAVLDLANSPWQIGFMKKLFKVPFPYAGLLDIVKRIVK